MLCKLTECPMTIHRACSTSTVQVDQLGTKDMKSRKHYIVTATFSLDRGPSIITPFLSK